MNGDKLYSIRGGRQGGIYGGGRTSTLVKRRDILRARSEIIKGKDQEIMKWKEEYGGPSI